MSINEFRIYIYISKSKNNSTIIYFLSKNNFAKVAFLKSWGKRREEEKRNLKIERTENENNRYK